VGAKERSKRGLHGWKGPSSGLPWVVEKLATNTTAFIQSATEFNATLTPAIGKLSSAIGPLSQVIQSQARPSAGWTRW